MRRLSLIASVLAALPLSAEVPPEALALQKAVHQAIDAAEPSIACILISRSTKYTDLGEGPSLVPGKLGGFTPERQGRFFDMARREMIRRLDLSRPETTPEGYGSGIVIDPSGLVLTNYHVVEGATKIYVRLPGNIGSYADIWAADGRSDLCVLKLLTPPAKLKAIKIGHGESVRKGDWVLSLANPFAAGFRDGSPSAAWGLVSNLKRRAPSPLTTEQRRNKPLYQYPTLMQTDARLNLGCSGGALLNLDGELIGMTTSLAALIGSETAGGYAMPMDGTTRKILEVLRRGQEVEYGFLGISVSLDDPVGFRGVMIKDASPGLPAARAGLRGGETIIAINGQPVKDHDDMFYLIASALAGSEVEVQVKAFTTTRTVTTRLDKATNPEVTIAQNRPKAFHGMRIDFLSTLGTEGHAVDGVAIRELDVGSAAEGKLKDWLYRSRLVITSVDNVPVASPQEFFQAVNGKSTATFEVVEAGRGGAGKKIKLP